jgi:hypothetical protein
MVVHGIKQINAAKSGYLHVLEYAKTNGCPYNQNEITRVLNYAAGHPEIMRRMQQQQN